MTKCKYTFVKALDKNKKPITEDIFFVRTLDTEKQFRDDLAAEMNGQIGILTSIMAKLEKNSDDPDAISAYTNLEFSTTRHEILKYAYAEVKNGLYIQNEVTRKNYEEKLDKYDLNEKDMFSHFFLSF